jgi:hypothetical protein
MPSSHASPKSSAARCLRTIVAPWLHTLPPHTQVRDVVALVGLAEVPVPPLISALERVQAMRNRALAIAEGQKNKGAAKAVRKRLEAESHTERTAQANRMLLLNLCGPPRPKHMQDELSENKAKANRLALLARRKGDPMPQLSGDRGEGGTLQILQTRAGPDYVSPVCSGNRCLSAAQNDEEGRSPLAGFPDTGQTSRERKDVPPSAGAPGTTVAPVPAVSARSITGGRKTERVGGTSGRLKDRSGAIDSRSRAIL